MKEANLQDLPQVIRVQVKKFKKNQFFAELPKYKVFTEANSFLELIWNVNDLIFAFFDIPKSEQRKIWYLPPRKRKAKEQAAVIDKKQVNKAILFKVLYSPDFYDNTQYANL